MGRPAKDSRLICGLLIVKHAERYADERVAPEYLGNPYVQAFCGEEVFCTGGAISPSLLSKLSKRLGAGFFEKFEREVLCELKAGGAIMRFDIREKARTYRRKAQEAYLGPLQKKRRKTKREIRLMRGKLLR